MRGEDRTDGALFSYVDIEARIPAKHPLRAMRRLTNAALAELDGAFSALYEACGRPSIPPERLLRATLLQLLYSIRSERQLVERLEFDMLFRWFVGLSIDEKVFDASTFSKNRDRLLTQRDGQQERQSAQNRRPERGRGEPALCDQPTATQAHRGKLRLEQDGGRPRTSEGARPRQSPRRVRLRHCRLQSCSPAQASGSDGRSVSSSMKRRWK